MSLKNNNPCLYFLFGATLVVSASIYAEQYTADSRIRAGLGLTLLARQHPAFVPQVLVLAGDVLFRLLMPAASWCYCKSTAPACDAVQFLSFGFFLVISLNANSLHLDGLIAYSDTAFIYAGLIWPDFGDKIIQE